VREIVINANAPLRTWSTPRAQKATLDRLQKIANLYAEIALIWGDIDQSIVSKAEDRIGDVKEDAEEFQVAWDEPGDEL